MTCNRFRLFQRACDRPTWLTTALLITTLSLSTLSFTPPPPARAQTLGQRILALQSQGERWIEIDLSDQLLTAWEGSQPVHTAVVSTGKATTPTPIGIFTIQSRYRVTRMQGDNYDIPDVPFVQYFFGNYGLHGTYWHNKFGSPVSNGCINLPLSEARWLFDWASVGVPVVVKE